MSQEAAPDASLAYLLRLVGLPAVLITLWHVAVVGAVTGGGGALVWSSVVLSELLGNGAVVLIAWGALRVAPRGAAWWVALGGVSVVSLFLVALQVFALVFTQMTGASLDGVLVEMALAHFGGIWGLFVSGSIASLLLLAGVISALVVGLALATRPWAAVGPRWSPWRGLGVVGLGVALAMVALRPLPWRTASGVERNTLVHVSACAVEAALEPSWEHAVPLETVRGGRLVPREEGRRPNLVFVWLESVSNHVTAMGGGPAAVTPNLTALAAEGLYLSRAYTVIPHSTKAAVATVCGVEPAPVHAVTESWPGAIPARCLPQLLGEQGYSSAFFRSGTHAFEGWPQLIFNMGFTDFIPMERMDTEGFPPVNYFGVADDVMLGPSRAWLQDRGGEPFFAVYMTGATHHDYALPASLGDAVWDQADPTRNRYLNALHYVDGFLGRLIAQYKELGLYEDTVFVIFGDHGEAFGEHLRYQHDYVPWEEGVHIPVVILAPNGVSPGSVVDAPTSALDLLPTSARLLGYALEGGAWPGVDVRQAPEDRSLYFHCFLEHRCAGFVTRDLKFIHHYCHQQDEVFDLSRDPLERVNLADAHREQLDAWVEATLRWRGAALARHQQHAPGAREPDPTEMNATYPLDERVRTALPEAPVP
ncbi:MAG: LTA synthase family protein [Deltaproteobacteria bacterium]|nr:LTA synthase family protein [Deltaproteobacteria bacterium]